LIFNISHKRFFEGIKMKSVSEIAPFIALVSESEAHESETEKALSLISSKPVGNSLLKAINESSTNDKFITIISSSKANSSALGHLTDSQLTKYKVPSSTNPLRWATDKAAEISTHERLGGAGEGVSVNIYWNKDQAIKINLKQQSVVVNRPAGHSPHALDDAFLSLAHELVHAFYLLNGKRLSTPLDSRGTRIHEELRAVGVPPFENAMFSENAIRREHHKDYRRDYYTIN